MELLSDREWVVLQSNLSLSSPMKPSLTRFGQASRLVQISANFDSMPPTKVFNSIPVDLIFFRKHPRLIGLQTPRYVVNHHLPESLL
ncbi:hypothetical protein J6590_080992 [Homalodisca vitripennis]|nr:hypothetical protein J6590_080992 [Homalodisca vitripennis]